jgi:hypothetical protein
MLANLTEKLSRKLLFKISSRFSGDTSERDLLMFLRSLHPVTTSSPLIRLGGLEDGGYLIPDDLELIARCFSPGVAYTSSFEKELGDRGIPSSLADYSVNNPDSTNAFIRFDKKFIGVANSYKFMTLESWIMRDAPDENTDLLLQMDIEKYEYPVLLTTPPEVLKRFRIMVIEFHSLDALIKRSTFLYIKSIFEKILIDFYVVHIHPNNCRSPAKLGDVLIPPVMEFTFYRKDSANVRGTAQEFPNPLDRKNVKNLPEINLPEHWYDSHGRHFAEKIFPNKN